MAAGAMEAGVRQESRTERDGAPADLEVRLLACARGSPALRRAVTRVAGRLAATKGWEELGYARLGDHAVERAGVSGRELRDLVAVDRALSELRGLERAFLDGRIGWTSLRLLCRVARPEDQDRWLALADALTARKLAREVRAVGRQARGVLTAGAAGDERREGVVLQIDRRARARWWHALGVASRVAGQRLSHAGFAEVLAAEAWLGLSRSRARALLRVERAARQCPALRAAFGAGRLSWVQAEALVPLLLDPAATGYSDGWVDHAGRGSRRRPRRASAGSGLSSSAAAPDGLRFELGRVRYASGDVVVG